MVDMTVRKAGERWFGIAWAARAFVATAIGNSETQALTALEHCLPRGAQARLITGSSAFADEAVRMLAELEAGDEDHKRVAFSAEYLSPPCYRILSAAAEIPIGYVSTYGAVANAARSESRAVGRAMATNPLYPIVPCHRVVGADFSMIGYGGRQDDDALYAKLGRLRAEARGMTDARAIETAPGLLTVYPVEWVLSATREADERRELDSRRAAARDEAASMQLHLF